jgi:hypothetical protein
MGLTVGVGAPIIFGGGRSARFDSSIYGSTLMRVIGWVSYGVCLLASLIGLVGYGAADAGGPAPFRGVSVVTGAFGAASFVGFAFDALWSAQEAEELASIMTQAPQPALRLAPVVAALRNSAGGSSPVIGLQGVF